MNIERQLEIFEWAIASIKGQHLPLLLNLENGDSEIVNAETINYLNAVVLDALILEEQLDLEDINILDKSKKNRILRILSVVQKMVSDNQDALSELNELIEHIEEQETL